MRGSINTTGRFAFLNLVGTFILSSVCFGQTLTDAQVAGAINRALSGKQHSIGLTLNDVQTSVFSGLVCTTCKTTGYTIFVYTPESWIGLKAVQARREMLPFGLRDVAPEMRLPYIHVLASPSSPEFLNANGMGMASSVHRIVLSNTERSDVVQPLSESHAELESNSALRSFTQASAGAVFSMSEVERLRAEDPKREFFIVVVGDKQNKYFKVKTKFFSQLFEQSSEGTYAELNPTSPKGTGAKEPKNINGNTAAETQPAQLATTHGDTIQPPAPAETAPSVVTTNANPDVGPRTTTPISTSPNAVATLRSPNATSKGTERVAVDTSMHISTTAHS